MAHTRKVLSQAGISLADIYRVEGSIVGIDALDVEDIKGVHELGATILAERLIAFDLIMDSTAVAASTAWNISLAGTSFPDSINRVLSIAVIADTAARVDFCSVQIGNPGTGVDHIIWSWDTAVDQEKNVRWGAPAVGTQILLQPIGNLNGSPNLIARTGAVGRMPNLVFRGISSAFGAGTVQARALVMVIRPDRGAPTPGTPSSHGLPLPSW